MRSGLDATTLALYISGDFDLHTRLKVENGSGTMIDLFGLYTALNLKLPSPLEPIGSLSVSFIREMTKSGLTKSLAPAVVSSTYNKLNDGTTYAPLLQLGRLVTIEFALTAVNAARPGGGGSWYECFRGYITKVDWPEWDSRKASIQCNGLGGVLQIAKSQANYTYTAGTTLDTIARQILDNNGFATVPIYFPVATGKTIDTDYAPGLQKTIWSQLWDLAQSNGWVVYYRYFGTAVPTLTFFEPSRAKTVSDMTIDAYDYRELSIDETELRNIGYVQYYDLNGVQQMYGPLVDSASIYKYGGAAGISRPFWIALEPSSPIRTLSEATALLTAALLDVSNPDAVATAVTFPLVFSESGVDLYTFKAMERLFEADQKLAPFSVSVDVVADQEPTSSVNVRGVPTAGSYWVVYYLGNEIWKKPQFDPDTRQDPDYGYVKWIVGDPKKAITRYRWSSQFNNVWGAWSGFISAPIASPTAEVSVQLHYRFISKIAWEVYYRDYTGLEVFETNEVSFGLAQADQSPQVGFELLWIPVGDGTATARLVLTRDSPVITNATIAWSTVSSQDAFNNYGANINKQSGTFSGVTDTVTFNFATHISNGQYIYAYVKVFDAIGNVIDGGKFSIQQQWTLPARPYFRNLYAPGVASSLIGLGEKVKNFAVYLVDPSKAGGDVEVWVNHDDPSSPNDPNVFAVGSEGTVTLIPANFDAFGVHLVSSADIAVLANISVNYKQPKTIYFRYVNVNGISTGIQWFTFNVKTIELNDPEYPVMIAENARDGDIGISGAGTASRGTSIGTYDRTGVIQTYDAGLKKITNVTADNTVSDQTGRSLGRFLAKPLVSDPDTADPIPDGTVKRVPTVNEATGGGRGFTALDAAARLQTAVNAGVPIADALGIDRVLENVRDAAVKDVLAMAQVLQGLINVWSAREGWGNAPGQQTASNDIYDKTGVMLLLSTTLRMIQNLFYVGAGEGQLLVGNELAANQAGVHWTTGGLFANVYAKLLGDATTKSANVQQGQFTPKFWYEGGSAGATYTPNWQNGNWHHIVTNGNLTIGTPTNPRVGGEYILEIEQIAAGGNTLTWPATSVIDWPGHVAGPGLTATGSRRDFFYLRYNGTRYYAFAMGANYL